MVRALTPARYRLQEAAALRRNQTNTLSRGTLPSQNSLVEEFRSMLDSFERGLNLNYIPAEIEKAVKRLLQFAGINAEMVRNQTPRRLWEAHLDPMYNTLRFCISSSKAGVDPNKVQEFWTLVGEETCKQLAVIAAEIGAGEKRFGETMLIIENELRKP